MMKGFFKRFLREEPNPRTIARLYGVIMAQSRLPVFFAEYGLPDDFETRFELLVVHLWLVGRRLGRTNRAVHQALIEFMVHDLDRTLREMGVGDVGVVKRMKHFMEAFYGRIHAYEEAMNGNDPKQILRVLDRNLYAAVSTDLEKLELMRKYIAAQEEALAAQDMAQINDGALSFHEARVH